MKPIVAIVGRPNVGKSTLFNKLIGRRKAIATDEPGVTRDLNFEDVFEGARSFTLVDTGGFEPDADEEMASRIREQAMLAVEEADAMIFLMDAAMGPSPSDSDIAAILRKSGKPVFYAVNKIDSKGREALMTDFYSLGLTPLFAVSAEHGLGVLDLLDAVLDALPQEALLSREKGEGEAEGEGDEAPLRVALVGRPNAGKSSLLNRLTGKGRAIVSEVAGTTRDSVDSFCAIDNRGYVFVDTAGIRKKASVSRRVETYCVMEAVRSIERCDVACLVLDGHDGVKLQDEKIAGLIERRGRGAVVVVNKWDIVEKDTHTTKRFEEAIRSKMPFLSYAPIVFVSALTGKRVADVVKAVDLVAAQCSTRVTTGRLNTVFEEIKGRRPPPIHRGRGVKLYYVTQTGTRPPTFVVFASHPEAVTEAYRRYLVNSIRAALDFDLAPVRVLLRKRS